MKPSVCILWAYLRVNPGTLLINYSISVDCGWSSHGTLILAHTFLTSSIVYVPSYGGIGPDCLTGCKCLMLYRGGGGD